MSRKTKTKMCLIVLLAFLVCTCSKVNADFIFGTPLNLGPVVNSSSGDSVPSPSADGLSLYFTSNRSGGYGNHDLWVTTRVTVSDPWDPPVNLGSIVNSSSNDGTPSISANGLELYFSSDRSGGQGNGDLWVARRETVFEPWSTPVNLGPTVNSSSIDWSPSISSDGIELFLHSDRPSANGGDELWVARRETTNDDWGSPVNLGPTVNSSSLEATPSISADGLLLFFQSDRAGGYGGLLDIWLTRRATKDDSWEEPMNLGPIVNSSSWEGTPGISADGSTLYFGNGRSGGSGQIDLWQVSIDPIVDLNGDGIVDAVDMCIMVDFWGTDESLCDIAPMPWGDGIVYVQDLIVLAEHPSFPGLGGNVIERRISASSDDAEEALNSGYSKWNDSSDLEIVDDHRDNGGRQLIGLTFRDIDIAPGEVISDAYIEFVCDETINGADDAYFLIWGHLTPNSQGFVAPFVISSRPKTEAKVPWEPDTWDAGGQKIRTVNIAPIIQELIDQEGWATGNAVEIIIGADPSKPAFTGVRCAESYDGSAFSAPLLHIEIAIP